jgi:BON domain-containing protein
MPSSMRWGGAIAERLFTRAMLCSLSLVFSASALGRQPPSRPARPDEHSGPHQVQASPKNKMPPENASPRRMPAARVEQEIQKRIKSNPAMATANVTARVDEDSVVLSGTVDSSRQHDLALLIAHSWAGQRKIVDQIKRRM